MNLLGSRFDAVLDAVAEMQLHVEQSESPWRIQQSLKSWMRLPICSINQARRGRLAAADVVNTLSLRELKRRTGDECLRDDAALNG